MLCPHGYSDVQVQHGQCVKCSRAERKKIDQEIGAALEALKENDIGKSIKILSGVLKGAK